MKVYKINDQRKTGVVIIYITSKITDIEHENILRLSAKSDLIFVFPKSQTKKISPKKFSYLYGAIFFGIGSWNDEATEIWEMIDYVHELTEYYSYSVVLQKDLGDLDKVDINSIERLQNSILETSVYTWRNLENQELQKLYTLPRKQLKFWRYSISFPGYLGSQGMYSKYKTEDKVLFIRPISISRLKDDLKHNSPNTLATFKGSGIKIMLPSLIPLDTNLNLNINNAKL